MTKKLIFPQRILIYILMTGLLGLSLLFALMPTPARAAGLTEPQIQAVLNLLVAFNVDQTTVKNVDAILHNKSSNSATVQTTTAATISAPLAIATATVPKPWTSAATPSTAPVGASPTCTLTATKSTVTAGEPVTLTWQSTNATYSSSPYGTTGANGAVTVIATEDTTYQKTVYGPGGSATCQTTITIIKPQTVATSTLTPAAARTVEVMSQSEVNVASVAVAVAQLPFALAIDSLTNIFVQLGIGQ